MIDEFRTTFVQALQRWALPLWCYYAVTLAVPLMNGAASRGVGFIGHALVVLAIPWLLIAMACGLAVLARAGRSWPRKC